MSSKRNHKPAAPPWALPWSAVSRRQVGTFGNGQSLLPRRKSPPRRSGRRK